MKKELNTKNELIKSLIDTQTAILDTIGESKWSEEKGYLHVEPSTILPPVRWENLSHHKNTVYAVKLDSKVSVEDIYELFGLKSTTYLRTNCHVGFPLNRQTQRTRGHCYITASKHVWGKT